MGWAENLLQILAQGIIAGVLPIFLFARAVTLPGRGARIDISRAGARLYPGQSAILALGEVAPSLAQLDRASPSS